MNWDDLRYVLAVVEHGSLAAAARHLGVNHATVLRRVGAFETLMGSPVFMRTAQGYQLRPDKLRLIEAAREVAHAVNAVERLGAGKDAQLTGHVRVTSTDTICLAVLPTILAELRTSAGGLNVTLICSNLHLNFARLEAEITVRPAEHLGEGLAGEVAGRMRFAVYASRHAEDSDLRWIGATGPLSRSVAGIWLSERAAVEGFAATSDSFLVMRELASEGIGRALLPCLIAEHDPRLRRVDIADCDLTVPLWVGCHAELAEVSRITALRTSLRDALIQRADLLDPPAAR